MRTMLRTLSSLLFICTATLGWANGPGYGRPGAVAEQGYYAPSGGQRSACRTCPQACPAPAASSACATCGTNPCANGCTPNPCGVNMMAPGMRVALEEAPRMISSGITCDGIRVTARQPNMCLLGDQYVLDLCVEAFQDVCDVTINTTLPEGVNFVGSDPEAEVNGSRVTWHLPHMSKCESRGIRINLRCEREGCLKACFCVTATPVAFCTIVCAKPVLVCHKCGPAEAFPGDMLHYTITVCNKGTCTAREVLVTDIIPVGLEHQSGQSTLTYKIGNLAPCQSKTINLCLRAAARGRFCNRAVVTACNAYESACESCVEVMQYGCTITKEGPKEVKIGQNADYNIVVKNTGDRPLTEVVIVDDAPHNTAIVSAQDATVSANRAVWRVDTLPAGQEVEVPITLTTCSPGYYCNRVHVTNAQGKCCAAESCTRWRGSPSINLCVKDMESPVCIGEMTSYNITVLNQGSEYDRNVRLTVRFPDGVTPVSATGPTASQVNGQVVTFAPMQTLNARQTVEYRVDARAKKRGDSRIKVEVMSDALATPLVGEESTVVN